MSTLLEISKDAVKEPQRPAKTKAKTSSPTDVNIEEMMRRAEQKQTKGVVAIRDPNTPPPKPKRLQQVKNKVINAASGEKATKYKLAAKKAAENPNVRRAAAASAAGGLAALSIAAGRKAPMGLKGHVAGTVAGAGLTAAAVHVARKKLANMSAKQKAVIGGAAGLGAAAGAAKMAHDAYRARTGTGGGGGGGIGRGGFGGGGGGGGGGAGAAAVAGAGARRGLKSPSGGYLPMAGKRLTPEQAASVRRGIKYAGIGAGTGMSGAYLDRVATGRDRA